MSTTHPFWQCSAVIGLLCLLWSTACEQQSQCRTSSDCAGETFVCRERGGSRLCLPIEADLSCPKSCNVDKDCAVPLCAGATSCQSGSCVKPLSQTDAGPAPETSQSEAVQADGASTETSGTKSIGSPCDLGIVGDCGPGMLCIGRSGDAAVCAIDCSRDETVCLKHPTLKICAPFSGTKGPKVCSSFLSKGGDCKLLFAYCGQSFPPLYCDDKTKKCTESILAKAGEPCNPPGDVTQPIRICDYTKKLQCNRTTKVCE